MVEAGARACVGRPSAPASLTTSRWEIRGPGGGGGRRCEIITMLGSGVGVRGGVVYFS